MALVAAGSAPDGATTYAELRGKRVPATVAPMPFVPHAYHR